MYIWCCSPYTRTTYEFECARNISRLPAYVVRWCNKKTSSLAAGDRLSYLAGLAWLSYKVMQSIMGLVNETRKFRYILPLKTFVKSTFTTITRLAKAHPPSTPRTMAWHADRENFPHHRRACFESTTLVGGTIPTKVGPGPSTCESKNTD